MSTLLALLKKYRLEITFVVVGGLNTLVDIAVFSLLTYTGIVPWTAAAQGCGYAAGMINSYFMNKYVTFQNKRRSLRQTVLFFVITGATLGLSMLLMWWLHDILGWNKLITKVFLVTPLVMIINYFGYKKVVFSA